eukprot:6469875-Amphidinium_carterae.2
MTSWDPHARLVLTWLVWTLMLLVLATCGRVMMCTMYIGLNSADKVFDLSSSGHVMGWKYASVSSRASRSVARWMEGVDFAEEPQNEPPPTQDASDDLEGVEGTADLAAGEQEREAEQEEPAQEPRHGNTMTGVVTHCGHCSRWHSLV